MNVSSIVVKTSPGNMEEVISVISEIDCCEVHFHDKEGKIVVTIDGPCIEEQIEKMKLIQGIPHVYSANLIYAYCEDEISGALDDINGEDDPVPDGLGF